MDTSAQRIQSIQWAKTPSGSWVKAQAISGHRRQSATFYLLAYPPMQILDVFAIKRPRIYNLPLKENWIKNSSRATKESR